MIKKLFEQFQNFITQNNLSGIIIAVASFLVVLLLSLSAVYDRFELTLYDFRFRVKPSLPQWNYLTLIDLDNNSINNIGKYPWPRSYYALGLDVLESIGVRHVAFDMEFPDESPQMVNRELLAKLEGRKKVQAAEIKEIIIDNDKILADRIKSMKRIILPFSFLNDKLRERDMDEKSWKELQKARKLFIEKASVKVPKEKLAAFKGLVDPEREGIYFPTLEFINAATLFGFVDSDLDQDGSVRKRRLVRMFEDRLYFNLAFVMLMDMCGVKKENVEVVPGHKIVLKGAVNPMTQEKADITVPINEKGMIYINWAGPFDKTFNHVPFYALMEYNKVKDLVHEQFDQLEIQLKKTERSKLYGELEEKYAAFNGAKDQTQKKVAWKEIREIRRKIREIEYGFEKGVLDDIHTLKENMKAKKDPALEQSAANLQILADAMHIVNQVESLRDHSCIAGLVATGTQDLGVIPVSSQFWMVGTYHNIINTILNQSFIHRVGGLVNYLLMLLVAVVMGFVVQRLDARKSLIMITVSFFGVNVLIMAAFAFFNVWVDQVGITLAMLLPSITIASIKFISEESQKRFIKSAFSHYLSPHVIDEIIQNPESLVLGGEMRNISIFFSDVAGFSTISEKLTPPELVALLNEYLSEMTDIILGYDGTVDKYEGDAIIAFYGAPHPYPDHAVKACLAAIDMKRRLAELRESWRKRGQDELRVRMGINTGDAVVGNMGSRTRMDYTMMGDSVNLASRLEGANKHYGTFAMISEGTYAQAKDQVEARQLDIIRVVGKSEPITVYELLGKKGQLPDYMTEMLARYTEGLQLFKEWEWDRSRTAFRAALKIVKDDGPCKTYIDRCTDFLETPPPKKWDGVYKLTSK